MGEVVHLLEGEGTGPLWGTATDDLNATLLAWGPGGGTPEHVNDQVDVLLVVVGGGGTLELDGAPHAIAAGDAAVVARGRGVGSRPARRESAT